MLSPAALGLGRILPTVLALPERRQQLNDVSFDQVLNPDLSQTETMESRVETLVVMGGFWFVRSGR